jgi:hypothetical protein
MLLVLALVTSAYADATFADVSVSGETPVDGTCAVTLEVTSDDDLYIFDGSSYSLNSIRWFLVDDGDPCELADLGAVYYEICGDTAVDADDNLVWTVSFDADEGTSGSWDVTDAVGSFTDAVALASVDWTCGDCDLVADINGDGTVGWQDYIVLSGSMGLVVAPGTAADLNGDNIINTSDLLILLKEWGLSCS